MEFSLDEYHSTYILKFYKWIFYSLFFTSFNFFFGQIVESFYFKLLVVGKVICSSSIEHIILSSQVSSWTWDTKDAALPMHLKTPPRHAHLQEDLALGTTWQGIKWFNNYTNHDSTSTIRSHMLNGLRPTLCARHPNIYGPY